MTDVETGANYVAQHEDPMFNPNRKSQLFFGLCDMRTATVALNVVNILFTVIVAVILTFMYAFDNGPYNTSAIFGVLFSAILVSAVSALGLYSAMEWKMNGMIFSTAAFAVILLVRLVQLDILDAIVTGFLLYPHVIFTMEMRSGVMSPETFDDEEYVAEGGRDLVEMANNYISPRNSMG